MPKIKGYKCTTCDAYHATWYGRCPQCNTWGSLEEEKEATHSLDSHSHTSQKSSDVHPLQGRPDTSEVRWTSRMQEFDQVLGGGAVPGSTILIGGEPGIGKSTLMLQYASTLDVPVWYITGEEILARIQHRAQRLNITTDSVSVICDTHIIPILLALEEVHKAVIVIDSIQTMHLDDHRSTGGSIAQLRHIAQALVDFSRTHQICTFIVSHITKDGTIAGPKQIEHLVDTVLMFEHGDADLRYIRAIKNRFGATDELGVFTLSEQGIQTIPDISQLFQIHRPESKPIPPGTISVPIFEGSRVFVIEIQALTVTSHVSAHRVYSDKIDMRRIARIAAVVEKHTGFSFSDQDIYINVAGGITIHDVGSDLALALSLYSARTGIPLPHRCCAVGELSLAGEIRPVSLLKKRLKAAQDAGYTFCLAPEGPSSKSKAKQDQETPYTVVDSLDSAFKVISESSDKSHTE